MRIIGKVYNFVKKHKLLSPGQHVLAAVSGGADSVALLYILHELADSMQIKITVAHLNHGLRGKEADKDAAFVRQAAKKLRLPFVLGRADVAGEARCNGVSLEMAGREARYKFLARTARKTGAGIIATAHTADDQAETLLLKLARGAGPRGLCGISKETFLHGIKIVRPLLGTDRNEIIDFLKRKHISWREDESNKDLMFLRNRVRHEILPLLEKKLNPAIRQTLLKTAEVLRDEDQWLEVLALDMLEDCRSDSGLVIERLKRLPVAGLRRVVRLWLVSAGVDSEQAGFDTIAGIAKLLTGKGGAKKMDAGQGWIVSRHYGKLQVQKGNSKAPVCDVPFRAVLKVPGETVLAKNGFRIIVSKEKGLIKVRGTKPGALPAKASISASAVGRKKIYVRSWKPGDRIKPFGMSGSKKIQDIFVDAKVPVEERSNIPIFECDGEIIWLPGYRVAQGWEVSDPADISLQIDIQPR